MSSQNTDIVSETRANSVLIPETFNSLPVVHSELTTAADSISSAVFVELCCGAAGFSAEMHTLGCDALGVDYIRNPSKPKCATLLADLSCETGQALVDDIFDHSNVQATHAAPPCGTASKARERPMPQSLIQMGAPAPRQLRSATYSLGLPNLSQMSNFVFRWPIRFMNMYVLFS